MCEILSENRVAAILFGGPHSFRGCGRIFTLAPGTAADVGDPSLREVFVEQLYSFGAVDRDPRERVISVAYYALVKMAGHRIEAASDARNAGWFAVDELPTLAFDHAEIIATALRRLKGKVRYEPIGFELLPEKFTLSELQHLYEVCLEEPIDKRNFRKKLLGLGLLKETDETQRGVAHRAARLYRFDVRRYKQLKKHGFSFWL